MTTPSFNLVREPWIPVTALDGAVSEVSLIDLFAQAHTLTDLAEPSPLTWTVLTRYLVAITRRTVHGPAAIATWQDLHANGQFDAKAFADYLERHEHRFDVFDPEVPFGQVNATQGGADPSPVSRLYLEWTSGNNPTLFDHNRDDRPRGISPAEAARAVLTANGYAFAGAGGKFYNTQLVAGYALTLKGATLFETLLLNCPPTDSLQPDTWGTLDTTDAPWWELAPGDDPPVQKGALRARGLTDLLTWRGRAIRLIPGPDEQVRTCTYLQRYQWDESQAHDPYKRYYAAASGPGKGQLFPRNFTPGQALWRDSAALFESHSRVHDDEPAPGIMHWAAVLAEHRRDEELQPLDISLIATGLVNNQARVDLWRMDTLPLASSLLTDEAARDVVRRAVAFAELAKDSLSAAGSAFAKTALTRGERDPDPNDVKRERASLSLEPRYWAMLDRRYQEFVAQLVTPEAYEPALAAWVSDLAQFTRDIYTEASNAAGEASNWFAGQE